MSIIVIKFNKYNNINLDSLKGKLLFWDFRKFEGVRGH